MICPDCNGTGWIKFGYEDHWHDVPCMECGGTGIRHCCEGERPGNVEDETVNKIPVAICTRLSDLAKPRVPSEVRKCRLCGADIWTSHDTLRQTTLFECTHCCDGATKKLANMPTGRPQ